MKKLFITAGAVLITALLALSGYSQNSDEIGWLGEIDKKQVVTYGDALKLFMLQSGRKPSTFEKNQGDLASEGIALSGYSEDDELTKGMLSKMTAVYLDLGGSLMYMIFGTERYAFRACMANGIFGQDGSENDRLSGPEMIEAFSKISEIRGEK